MLQIRPDMNPKIDLRKIIVFGLLSKLGIFFTSRNGMVKPRTEDAQEKRNASE